jgi:hypothetical protein
MSALKDLGPAAIADEFLNFQFGILPLWNDIKNLGTSLKNHDKILKQLERDSGRLVRRSLEFPVERNVVSESTAAGGLNTSFSSLFYSGTVAGTTKKTVTVEKRRWFSGAFTYYLPTSEGAGKIARWALEADKLFGVIPDPQSLWNLIPFSWAVDWVADVGGALQNLTNFAQYGLVMPYGYMMETSIAKYQYTFTPSSSFTGPGSGGCTLEFHDVVKQRVKASPFGFGVTWDGFNPTQIAILAALGIQKSPF